MKSIVILTLFSLFCACSAPDASLAEEVIGLKEQIKLLESSQGKSELNKDEVRHTVAFCLKCDRDAPETLRFLQDAQRILSAIPGVQNFEVSQQVSPKNEYHFGFSMVFANAEAYQAYNDHPEHVKFVKERWDTEVSKFLEADFKVTGLLIVPLD